MPMKGYAAISLPEEFMERIKKIQEHDKHKINPTGFMRKVIEEKIELEEARIQVETGIEEKMSNLLDEIIEELKHKGEKGLVKKINEYFNLDEELFDKQTEFVSEG